MRRALILTGHFPVQKRRASLHWVAHHLQETGWHVTIATLGYSWFSRVRRDPRLMALRASPRVGTYDVSPTLTGCFGWSPIHPFSTRSKVLDRMLAPIHTQFASYWRRRLKPLLKQSDLVIAESGPPVLLGPAIARHAPNAARIYRVNDDLRLLNAPAFLLDAEKRQSPCFTRISTASPYLAQRFEDHPNVTLDPMGVPEIARKIRVKGPRQPGPFRVVCAGTSQIDIPALLRISEDRPNWQITVYGRMRHSPPMRLNLRFEAEQVYETVLAEIASADIGLAPYPDRPGIEYQATNSNRLMLYRLYGLPVLAPDRLCAPAIPAIVGYSAPDAYGRCERMPRRPENLPGWSELAMRLAQNPETDPPKDVSTPPLMVT